MFFEDLTPVRRGGFALKQPMKLFSASLFLLLFTSLCFGEAEEYILQPGDVISISVVEHPEFSGKHKIRPDGRINYPVIGELDVASLTCAQLVKIMQGKLSSYVNNPVVSVSIEEYYSNKIYIIGAVRQPGQYQIYEPIDILKAVAMCGGLQNLKVKTIRIIRGDGTVVPVETKTLWGNEGKRDTKKYVLYPGDTMYVPDTFEIPWAIILSVLTIIVLSLEIVIYTNSLSHK
jgi:polysaccharide export outer membrane protein